MRRPTARTLATLAATAVFGFSTFIFPFNASALQSTSQTTDYATYRLVTATDATGTGAGLLAGLDITLNPGWHSYWRMPGEGGLAPTFDWTGSKNIKTVDVRWPAPQRFEQLGMYSFGYAGTELLPLNVTLEKPGTAATLDVKAEIMVCNDICIPQHVTLSLGIPAGDAKKSADAARLDLALKDVPHADNMPALKIDSAIIGPKALVVRAWSRDGFDKADLFAEVKDGTFFFTAPPKIEADKKDPRGATMILTPPEGTGNMADALMHHTVILTLVKGKTAIEKRIDF
jgi:suppressor for copper-sensitivity B